MGFTWKILVWFRRKAKVLIDSFFNNKAENPSLTDAWLTLMSEDLVISKEKLSFHKYSPSGEWEWLHDQSPYFRKWDDGVCNRSENTLKKSCIFIDSFSHKSLSYHKLSRSCMLNHCFLNLPENETVNLGTCSYKPFFEMNISKYLFIWLFIFKHLPTRFIYVAGRRRAVFMNHSGQKHILTK